MSIIALHGKYGSGKDTVAKIIQYLIFINSNPENEEYYPLKNFIFNLLNNPSIAIEKDLESDWQIKKLGLPIKQIASIITGIPIEKMETQEDKEIVLREEWKTHIWFNHHKTKFASYTLRELLQKIGDVMLNVHPDWLLNVLFKDYENSVGYAPGSYMCICGKCGITFIGDKRAVRCEKCSIFYPSWIITDLRKPNEYEKIKELGGKCVKVIKFDKPDCNACDMEDVKQVDCYSCINYPEIAKDEHISETALDNISEWDYIIEAKHGDIDSLIKQTKEMLIKFEII